MNRTSDWWDRYFLGLAKYVSTASKDPSTKTGAVIVASNKRVVSLGYNGFPAGMPDHEEYYEDRSEKLSRIIHCEINSVIAAGHIPEGSILYTYPFMSCERCVVHMIQAGILNFVAPKPTHEQIMRWGASFELSKQYMEEVNAKFTEVEFE